MTLAFMLLALPAVARAQEQPRTPRVAKAQTTDRLIVRLAAWADTERTKPMAESRARTLSTRARTRLDPKRRLSGGAHVVQLTHEMALPDVQSIAARLMADPAVVNAEPDVRKLPLLAATDPLYQHQWALFEPAGGINAQLAWDTTAGSSSVVVAVIDTGILPNNPDIAGRLVAGWDFIREDAIGMYATANDGDARDSDPSDPGDWVAANEAGQPPFQSCPQATDSTWHGTHTTGIIAASANNGYGIAGVAWGVRILPLRVLGKCGGYTSDIIDAMRWAGGLPVPGMPANANPAQVVNMSLGAVTACSVEEQRAIDDVIAAGQVRAIVTSAGNDSGSSAGISPANCRGVIAVTATDRAGSRATYSSTGTNVAIAAPGGWFANGGNAANGILSLFNSGLTTPQGNSFAFGAGTSEAAAHVSGVAALVLSANGNLSATEMRALLQRSARVFPDASCNTNTCGAGIVDAGAAVAAALQPQPQPAPAPVASSAATNSGGGGGGGGGCVAVRSGAPELALPLAALWAALMIWRRRERRRGAH